MLWHRETHINPQRNRWIIVDPAGIELTTSRLRQLRQLPVVQHVRFTPLKSRLKRNSNDMPVAALDNWQPVWNAQVSISTPVCVNFELRPGAGDIHFCWFNFDALAQGNAYKPYKRLQIAAVLGKQPWGIWVTANASPQLGSGHNTNSTNSGLYFCLYWPNHNNEDSIPHCLAVCAEHALAWPLRLWATA